MFFEFCTGELSVVTVTTSILVFVVADTGVSLTGGDGAALGDGVFNGVPFTSVLCCTFGEASFEVKLLEGEGRVLTVAGFLPRGFGIAIVTAALLVDNEAAESVVATGNALFETTLSLFGRELVELSLLVLGFGLIFSLSLSSFNLIPLSGVLLTSRSPLLYKNNT